MTCKTVGKGTLKVNHVTIPGVFIIETPKQFDNLVEKRTLELLKRFGHETLSELEYINNAEYATSHFDITTVKLIVETLMREALELGMPNQALAELGLKAVCDYPCGQLDPIMTPKLKRKGK